MRPTFAAFVGASLLASSVIAQAAPVAPLPSGKPAGVEKAALGGNLLLVLLGSGIVIGGIALAVSGPGSNGVTTPTTTGTP